MKTYAFFDNSFFTQKPWWLPIKLYNVIYQRSNPRTQEYMLALLSEKFPDAELIFANGGDRETGNTAEQDVTDINLRFEFGVGGSHKMNSSSWITDKYFENKTNRNKCKVRLDW